MADMNVFDHLVQQKYQDFSAHLLKYHGSFSFSLFPLPLPFPFPFPFSSSSPLSLSLNTMAPFPFPLLPPSQFLSLPLSLPFLPFALSLHPVYPSCPVY